MNGVWRGGRAGFNSTACRSAGFRNVYAHSHVESQIGFRLALSPA